MYNMMREHWRAYGPPAYISAALAVGHKIEPIRDDDEQSDFRSPQELGQFLQGLGMGSVIVHRSDDTSPA